MDKSTVRNSYARHLRNQNKPSGSGGEQKPKWYLADVLSFLKDHMQHRKQKGNSETEVGEEESVQSVTEDSQEIHNENIDVVNESTGKRHAPSDFERQVRPKKKLPSDQIVGPMIDFLKSNTNKNVQEHPLLNYVKGMLPDYDTLTPRRQRIFKQKIVTLMNDLMDEQEMERSSTPPHSYTSLSCANSEVSATSDNASVLTTPHDQSGSDDNYANLYAKFNF